MSPSTEAGFTAGVGCAQRVEMFLRLFPEQLERRTLLQVTRESDMTTSFRVPSTG